MWMITLQSRQKNVDSIAVHPVAFLWAPSAQSDCRLGKTFWALVGSSAPLFLSSLGDSLVLREATELLMMDFVNRALSNPMYPLEQAQFKANLGDSLVLREAAELLMMAYEQPYVPLPVFPVRGIGPLHRSVWRDT